MSSRCLSFSSFHQAREELSSHDEIAEQYRKMLLVRDSGSETEVDRSEVDEPQAPIDDYDEVLDEFERPEAEEQEAEQQHGASGHGWTREMQEEEEELAREEPPATSSKAAGMPPSAKPSSPTCELKRGPQNLRL